MAKTNKKYSRFLFVDTIVKYIENYYNRYIQIIYGDDNVAKNSQARIAANKRYSDKAYDRINIAEPKGNKAIIKNAADKAGQSVNAYVQQAIQERLQREGAE